MAVSHVKSDTIADWTGTVTVLNSQAATVTVAATDLVRPSNWNSAHNQFYTLIGNTTSNSTASGTNVQWSGAGAVTVGGTSDTVIISGWDYLSSYAWPPGDMNAAIAPVMNGASISQAVAFNLPNNISASFIRIPISMSASSGTGTTSAAVLNGSGNVTSTWNAVIYSVGSGANSRSLQSVASGSCSWVWQNSVSANANGSQWTITQALTYFVEGNSTSTSTSYAASTSNYSFVSTNFQTSFTGGRYLDINFANSLEAGQYWLVVGYSSATATNSARAAQATQAQVNITSIWLATQVNNAIGVMGSTNLTSSPLNGGAFSTAGGGTTNSIPLSAISSTASHPMMAFEMLRSA